MNTLHEQAERLCAQSSSEIQADHFDTAEALLVRALDMDPGMAEAHANLAWLLDRRGSVSEAVRHYELAIEAQPDNARIHLNFGAKLAELKFFHAAEAAYQKALLVDPTLPGTWRNLGVLLAQNGRDAEAETHLRKALALDPKHAAAHVNLACLLLRQGRFDEGWHHLEFRHWVNPIEKRLRCSRWKGQPLQDRVVLVMCEAGFGDTIQFCRFVAVLRALGAAQVDVLSHPDLKPVLQTLDGVGDVFGFEDDTSVSDWDYWVPAMSVPLYALTQLDTIPAAIPYVQAPADRLDPWRQMVDRLSPRPALRVGLVWHGNPASENDAQRSLPSLQTLAPLWRATGVQFFSLQKGNGEREVKRFKGQQPLIDLAPELHNFADTAAAIMQLDLVISVDTAVAHLAAALGKPCWLLLPAYMTDWRWLKERTDSPWYPQVMRLWRQPKGNDWTPVLAQVCEALQTLAQPASPNT